MSAECLLRGNTAAPGKHVQRHPLAKQQMSRFAFDSCDMFHRIKNIAFLNVPFYSVHFEWSAEHRGART
jgi:hypothetical protein